MAMDKKKLERLAKLVNTVTGFCKEPNMNLKNSPPFILYVLPQIYQHLRTINTRYEATPQVLNDMEYMHVFVENLMTKCQQCVSLFDVDPVAMLDKNSEGRRTLTKLTLAFSHMMYELKAFFPDGTYAADSFAIVKVDAANWWRRYFDGSIGIVVHNDVYSIVVTWQKFINALREVHSIGSSQLHALKDTVDLTCSGHISVFEFDVFTKLFQPWSSLLQCWNALAISHQGYMAFCTYEEVSTRLQAFINKPGSYVFRLSCSRLGQWAIGYVDNNKTVLQMIPPQNRPLFQVLIDGSRTGLYLYPDGNASNPDLTHLLNINACRVKETEEQHETYCQMDTTYQLCKICAENDKNTRLEPCGHLLCSVCLHQWQRSGGKSCPFCRKEICSTEPVSIEAYKRTETLRSSLHRNLDLLANLEDATPQNHVSIYATPTNTRRNSIHLTKPPTRATALKAEAAAAAAAALAADRSSVPPIPPRRQSPGVSASAVNSPKQTRRTVLTPSASDEKLSSSRKGSSDSNTDVALSALCQAVRTMGLSSSTPMRSAPSAGSASANGSPGRTSASRQMSQSDDHLDFIVRPGQGQGRNVDSNCLATLIREGFSHDKARRALEISVDNLTMAREILLNFT